MAPLARAVDPRVMVSDPVVDATAVARIYEFPARIGLQPSDAGYALTIAAMKALTRAIKKKKEEDDDIIVE